jgi:PAS domain S-box-containing protein
MWNRQLPRSGTLLIAAVFLLGLCLAAGAAWWRQNDIDQDAEIQFQHSVERVMFDIIRRFRQPVFGLNGAKGLYAVSTRVQRAAFQAYVESRDLSKEFPGVRGFGFIQHVMRSELDVFVAAERADGAPGFTIRQLVDRNHDDLYIIKFIEPAADNAGAQGLDIGSEANRRAAAQRAIDSGEPAITAAITLVQDNRKTPGVLLFVPVYAHGTHPANADERRAALVGLLYAPIVIAELLDKMADVGAGRIDFELFDRAPGTPGGTLLYDADHHLENSPAAKAALNGRRLSITRPLSLPLGDLTLQASSSTEFDAAIDRSSKWLVFAGIALLSTMLALLLRQQATGRRRAEALAHQMTEQLRQDQERSSDFSRSAADWFWETDAEHRFCYFSDNFEAVYGLAPGRLLGKSRKDLLVPDAMNPAETIAAHMAQLDARRPFKNFEYRIRIGEGDIRWIMVSGLPHADAGGHFAGYRGTGTLVTERKQMLEALQESEARHRAQFEHAKLPMLLIDPKDGAIVDGNEAAGSYYGYSREKLRTLFMSAINQLPPDEILAEMARAKSEQRDSFYFQHRLASGEIRQVEVHSGPLEIDGRQLLYSVINDVTERRAAEMALVTETARLHALLETASDGIHILDMNGKLIQCSHSFAAMLGYTDAEISGFNVADWDAKIPKEGLVDAVRELIKAPARFETRHRRKDGTLIDVEIHAKAVEIGGEIFLYNSSRDITERKHHEDALANQSRRLNDILEGTHVGTWEWNVQTGETVFNQRWAEIIGYTLEELAPISIETWMKLAHPDDVKLSGELLEKHFAGELGYYECESRMRHKDGHWVWVLDRGKVASWTAAGKPLLMSGTHQDITERKNDKNLLNPCLSTPAKTLYASTGYGT